MYEKLHEIKKVYETNNVSELNNLLEDGWVLLEMYSEFHDVNLPEPLKSVTYVLGAPYDCVTTS